MNDKYVLVSGYAGVEPLYWTDFMEHDSTGLASQIHYTCCLHEAQVYDTIEDAERNIVGTFKGELKSTTEFEVIKVTSKQLFEARLKGE